MMFRYDDEVEDFLWFIMYMIDEDDKSLEFAGNIRVRRAGGFFLFEGMG